MASRLGAKLLLVHILPAIPDLPKGVSIFKECTYSRELHESASKQLSELTTTLANTNVKVRSEVGNSGKNSRTHTRLR